MNDLRTRFLFEGLPIRGLVVKLQTTLDQVFEKKEYPEDVKALISQFMVASALLSATIKFEGSLILQVKGQGQINTLMAECKDQLYLRAIAQMNENRESQQPMLGDGQMAITIEPKRGERYQGIVKVSDLDLAEVLESYFLQSEQLQTRFWFAANTEQSTNEAAGMLLQRMPEDASQSTLDIESEDWNRVNYLAATLTESELLQLPAEALLTRLFHEESVRVYPSDPLQFQCSCSQQRCADALISLGELEARSLLAEQAGTISMDCQFCNAHYDFDQSAIDGIFNSRVH